MVLPLNLIRAAALAAALLLASGPVRAADHLDARVILEQQAAIRADASAGQGRYATLDERSRRELYERQAVVERLLAGKTSLLDLTEADRIIVVNALESISAIINGDESGRSICRRHKPTGSNRAMTVCKTVAQIAADKRAADADAGKRSIECSDDFMGPGGCARVR